MKPSDRYNSLLEYYSYRVGLPFTLVKRQMMQESLGNPRAVSPCGAIGLMQLMPVTAREMRCLDPWNPEENIRAGTEYLAKQASYVRIQFDPDKMPADEDVLRFALAAYNGGFGYVREALNTILARGDRPTWNLFVPEIKKVVYRGKRPDSKQIIEYVERIHPPEGPIVV